MAHVKLKRARLLEKDLDFLVETVSPDASDKPKLKSIILEDEDFQNNFISNEKVFKRLLEDNNTLVEISPFLFFEILLRNAMTELSKKIYTLERAGTMNIPVFDTDDVVGLFANESLLIYLADMLSSFTRVERYAISMHIGDGRWHEFHINDFDIRTLIKICDVVDEEYRIGLYKRIADICLFVLGMFPDFSKILSWQPAGDSARPQTMDGLNLGMEDFEEEGQKYYKLAAEHRSAKEMELSDIFWNLHENFTKAKKPLIFIAENYLTSK